MFFSDGLSVEPWILLVVGFRLFTIVMMPDGSVLTCMTIIHFQEIHYVPAMLSTIASLHHIRAGSSLLSTIAHDELHVYDTQFISYIEEICHCFMSALFVSVSGPTFDRVLHGLLH